jgi:hypothetical protein
VRAREFATVSEPDDLPEPDEDFRVYPNVGEYLSEIGSACWVGDLPLRAFASEIERLKNGESEPDRLAIIGDFEEIARAWAEAGGPPKIWTTRPSKQSKSRGPKRQRKRSLASISKQALKAGASKATVREADGSSITLEFDRSISADTAPQTNEWDTIQ